MCNSILHVGLLLGLASFCVEARASGNCGSAFLRAYNTFPRPRTCEPIQKEYDICSRVGNYRATRIPNFLNHESQSEAHSQLANFRQLIATQCSDDLLFFLCLHHFPLCVHGRVNPIVPCRGLCERVRDSCTPTLARFNRTWPERLNCDALPEDPGLTCEDKEPEVCVSSQPPSQGRPRTPNDHKEWVESLPTSGAGKSSSTEGNRRAGVSLVEPATGFPPELPMCHWETANCSNYCRRASSNRRLFQQLEWAIVVKVDEVKIGNNCATAVYLVNVTQVLLGQFSARQIVHIKARERRGCLCPLLEPGNTYFLARRGSSSPARSSCQRRHDKTICSMKHKDIAHHLSIPWRTTTTRKEIRKFLQAQRFPRWLNRLTTPLLTEKVETADSSL